MALTSAEIDTAIRAVLLNQSYSLNGRTYTRANLRELREMREQVLKEEATADGSRTAFFRFGSAQ